MNTIERVVLNRFKALMLQRVKPQKVILVGSRARGDAHLDSDMDVIVVLDGALTPEDRNLVGDCAWEAAFEQGVVIVPVVFSREEWENGPERSSLLAQAVELEGIDI
jgi:hypothetical protein